MLARKCMTKNIRKCNNNERNDDTGKLFSKMDNEQAFHQIKIAPDSREINAFITKRGLFIYTRLMIGMEQWNRSYTVTKDV